MLEEETPYSFRHTYSAPDKKVLQTPPKSPFPTWRKRGRDGGSNTVHTWGSGDNSWESVLSFHHLGSRVESGHEGLPDLLSYVRRPMSIYSMSFFSALLMCVAFLRYLILLQ